jgi:aspartate aminotransferase
MRESATIAVAQQARALRAQGRRVVDLGAGEPDFPTPPFVCEDAARAVAEGATHYTSTEGIPALREALAAHAAHYGHLGRGVAPNEIVVSCGSKQSIFNACFVLFGAGDEVLIPTPAWTSYYEIVQLARAHPVGVAGDPSNDLKVTAADLIRASTPRTKGLILNSPCNPTGAVYSAEELRAILDAAEQRGWWVISDEIYARLTYEGRATSVFDVAPSRERVILMDGVAKAYAMTGWRVGWSIATPAVSRAMTALQSHVTYHTATVSQHAALSAISRRDESEAAIAVMLAAYRQRRDEGMRVLSACPGLTLVRPAGAFYYFVNVAAADPYGADRGSNFARRLLDEHGVAIVPGVAFGTPDWIRISYASPVEQVLEGVQRVVQLFSVMSQGAAKARA